MWSLNYCKKFISLVYFNLDLSLSSLAVEIILQACLFKEHMKMCALKCQHDALSLIIILVFGTCVGWLFFSSFRDGQPFDHWIFFSVTFYHLTPSTYLNISGNGWPFRENPQVDIHTAEYVRISTKSLHRIWVILVHDLSLSISCYKLRYLAKKKCYKLRYHILETPFVQSHRPHSPESLEVQTLLIILFSSDVQCSHCCIYIYHQSVDSTCPSCCFLYAKPVIIRKRQHVLFAQKR